MAYLYLLVALCGGLSKGYIGRRTSFLIGNFKESVLVNTIRSGITSVIALVLILVSGNAAGLALPPEQYLSVLISAVCMATFSIAWIYAYRTEAYLFLNVFTMLGSILTAALGFAIYSETVSTARLCGMALLVVATLITSLYNKSLKGKMKPVNLCLLIIGATGSAIADFSQKVYRNEGGENPLVFTLYTYFIGFLLQLLFLAFLPKCQTRNTELWNKKHLLLYFGYGFFLFVNSIGKTAAAGLMPASQMYPLLQSLNLVLSAVMAAVLMKEKPTKQSLIGILIALTAIVFMNL